jgi:L-seryl-tRNA(Ser) seleniumtransferase
MSDFADPDTYWSWHIDHGYARVINVSGTMTSLGGSIVGARIREATVEAMGRFVKIHEMQAEASRLIAELSGAEAGCLTASASAGITLGVGAAISGLDPYRAQQLPNNPGPRNEVVVQVGHLVDYGAPVSTAVELAGGTVRPVGQATSCADHQLSGALGDETAAALFVVSHHVVNYGQMPLKRFAEICHAKGVPVIVDAASEYDLKGFVADGADLVIYSAHKFLGGPTGGIIAGRKDLVRAAYLQNTGIARGMKIGKESIAGIIQTLKEWKVRDHAAVRAREQAALDLWLAVLAGIEGVYARIIPDPTNNPLDRLQIDIDAEVLGASAATLVRALGEQEPALIVRGHEAELGYFQMDPCNLTPGQAEMAADILKHVLARAKDFAARPDDLDSARNGGVNAYLSWLAD